MPTDSSDDQVPGGSSNADTQALALSNLRKNARPPSQLLMGDNKVENWKTFKARWDNYVLLSDLSVINRKLQVAQLENCLGDDALKAMSSFKFETPEGERIVKEILKAFEEYIVGELNETLERYKFAKRKQQEGEPYNSFLCALRQLLKNCKYCDRIVVGIRDSSIREELLKKSKLMLDKCVKIARHTTSLSSVQSEQVHKVAAAARKRGGTKKSGTCRYCATTHVFIKEECPAWGKTCKLCRKKNHFEACCKTDIRQRKSEKKRRHKVNCVGGEDVLSSDSDAVDEWINSIKSKEKNDKEVKCRMHIGGNVVDFQIDTGASCNLLPKKLAKDVRPYVGTLRMWNNTVSEPVGVCRRVIKNPKNSKR